MSEGHNLGLGILLGVLLTGGLVFALSQQSGLAEAEPVQGVGIAQEPSAAASFSPFVAEKKSTDSEAVPLVVDNKEPESVAAIPEESSVAVAPRSLPVAAANDLGVLGEKSVPAASAELVEALPEHIDLSVDELGELSAEERARYEKMLMSYREIREEVLALDRERSQLKQRMDGMFQRNEVIEQKVKEMRQSAQVLADTE